MRWKYISNLDEDFTQKYINDGTTIFYLPNKDTYIIEKLFARNMEPVYGTATYTLDESDFEKYKKSIIDSKTKTINNAVLSKLNCENNSVNKIVHTGWSDAISKYLM